MKFAFVVLVTLAIAGSGWVYLRRAKAATPPLMAVPEKKLSDWTPEKIVDAPEDYLNFCEAQVNSALAVLKVRQVAIESAKGSFSQQRDREAAAIAEAEPVLQQLNDLAKTATDPAVQFAGQSHSREWLKKNMDEIESQLAAKRKLLSAYDDGLARLAAEQSHNPQDQSAALQQLAEIKMSREFLRINRMNDDYSRRLLEMRTMVQGVVASAGPAGNVTLDDLAGKQR